MSTAVTTSRQVQGDLQLQRPARALIGWMGSDEGAQWLAGPGQSVTDEHREAVRRAHATVAGRPAGFDQAGAMSAMPDALVEQREALRQNADSAPYFAEGWDVAIADLSKICAIQRHVLTDDAKARVAAVDGADILNVASVALPLAEKRSLAAVFDEHRQAWVFSSANPNLRIAGQVHAEVKPGAHAFGFIVSVSTSFLQVARYRDRYLLRDGYHRAYGFLARGITHVPVFTRTYDTFNEMRLPAGLSPQDTYLGDRPPLLSDYLENTVSASVVMPVTQKVVLVQGLEVSTLG